MEEGALGLSLSESGNMATPLPSGERVPAVAGMGGERLETEEKHRISAICALCSVKRRKKCSLQGLHGRRAGRITDILQSRGSRRYGRTCVWSQDSGGPASLRMFKEPHHEHSDLCHVSRDGPPSLELIRHLSGSPASW